MKKILMGMIMAMPTLAMAEPMSPNSYAEIGPLDGVHLNPYGPTDEAGSLVYPFGTVTIGSTPEVKVIFKIEDEQEEAIAEMLVVELPVDPIEDVPEPGILMLLGMGLLAWARRIWKGEIL